MRVIVQAISTVHGQLAIASIVKRTTLVNGKPVPVKDEAGNEIWEAGQGRFFPVSDPGHEIEVLGQDEDPPVIVREIPNHITGGKDRVERPDPDRMGRRSYQALLEDKRFRIVQNETVDMKASDAAVAAARAEVARISAELMDARAEIARLTSDLEAATKPAESAPGATEGEKAGNVKAPKGAPKETPPSA